MGMKALCRNLAVGLAVVAIAAALFLAFDAVGPAFSTSALTSLVASVTAPTPPPGDVIPLQSIANLTSLNATVKIDVNGLIDGKRAEADLTGLLSSNDQKKSRITVSGSLLGPLAAKVGGSLVGMFTPSKVDLYNMPDGTYIVVNSLVPICVKPKALNDTSVLDEISPKSLLTMLTKSDVVRGKLIGEEMMNGVAVKHYVINGDAFLAAAQKSSDPKLQEFAQALWAAEDADLYLDAKTGYPVAFRGQYNGVFDPIKFQGDFGVQLDVTGVNSNPAVSLPSSCNKPISQ
jgi:hypothetical protein